MTIPRGTGHDHRDPQPDAAFRATASGRSRRAASGAGDGWGDDPEGRPAYRPAAPGYRETGRIQALQPVDRLYGSARLRLDDVQRARLCARDRKAAGYQAAAAGA